MRPEGKDALPRWWFNLETGKCEQFYHGGCGGNENRYIIQQKCEQTYLNAHAATNFEKQCGQKADAGFCNAKLPYWWFNPDTGKCEEFYYGGCGGNENRYLTQQKCERTCLKAHAAVSSVCHRPPSAGPCKASFPRFYYDHKTKSCRLFVYGGCQSNGNNFKSREDCMRSCGSWKPSQPMPKRAP
ncbi:hypothetical protein HPB50_002864 [Hyalomma asiaticum]|uniref:Uncharacterized protein n=1 Tax=Hyalomma asiaticum TaxID=266040 RepID=A0ACB7RUX1_HYAAI|nr:hypothetical protein HPB50_002864 [Hyalomma asiaticum]